MRKLSTKRAAKARLWTFLALCLAGCVPSQVGPIGPAAPSSAEEHIGKTYRLHANAQLLCPKPDLPFNQALECVVTPDGGGVTVVDVVENQTGVFPKVRLANGKEGYILEEELRRMERESQPSPRVGMTESEALITNWGVPAKKNMWESAGHRLEQWDFPALGSLYVEDGVLTSIQRFE